MTDAPEAEEPIGIQVARSMPGAPVVVTLGGLNLRPGLPNWEFARALDRESLQLVFVRDLRQGWYQHGIQVSSSFDGAVEEVAGVLETLGAPSVSIVGSSAAGLLGLRLAERVGAYRTLLFTPQTTIHPLDGLRMRDFRWPRQVPRAYRARDTWLRAPGDMQFGSGKVRIVYGASNRLDVAHAMRMHNVIHDPLPGVSTHMVAKHLRDSGRLAEYLDWLVGAPRSLA